jgi:hypothetical protein
MQLAKHESEGDHLGAVERNARAVVQLLTFSVRWSCLLRRRAHARLQPPEMTGLCYRSISGKDNRVTDVTCRDRGKLVSRQRPRQNLGDSGFCE